MGKLPVVDGARNGCISDSVRSYSQPKTDTGLTSWFDDQLRLSRAPETKLILYPQYPEIRLSGFLRGCETAPSQLMKPRSREYEIPSRMLVLGINSDKQQVFAFVGVEGSPVYLELQRRLVEFVQRGVFYYLSPLLPITTADSKTELLRKLGAISQRGWIVSKRLDKLGNELPCLAPNCGGLTLEAEFGILPNSRSEPDYLGWEIKQHAVKSFDNLERRLRNKGSSITLMTPEPKEGAYVELGVEGFVRRCGYIDKIGRPDRMNFGGKHVCEVPCDLTGLTLTVDGFDPKTGKMRGDGKLMLVKSGDSEPAAVWPFGELLRHWSRKHAKAGYVPSMRQRDPQF